MLQILRGPLDAHVVPTMLRLVCRLTTLDSVGGQERLLAQKNQAVSGTSLTAAMGNANLFPSAG
jgi:hypothetical protein